MHVDLLDVLCCPAEHEASQLVARVDEWCGRHIVTGWLGCPLCRSRYPVRAGVAFFGEEWPAVAADVPDPLRLAALLDLVEPGGVVLLAGRYAQVASALAALAEVHPVALGATSTDAAVSVLQSGRRLPFRDAVLRAAALDELAARCADVEEFVRVLRPSGRLVAAARLHLPRGLKEVARDASEWVAERAGPIVQLGRPIKPGSA